MSVRARTAAAVATVGVLGAAAAPQADAHELTAAQAKKLERRWQISSYKEAWYKRTRIGHWSLRPGFERCAQIRWPRPRGQCYRHRENLRWHVARKQRIDAILHPPPPAPAPVTSSGPGWLVGAFLCIHRGEGAWNANTGNGFYGGLQMDWDFMRSYGGEYLAAYGTADRWPASTQIAVAVRAYLSGRGFYPWPNTARACGLL